MTMNQFIPANLIELRCDEWLGPFCCELTKGHTGVHQWDGKRKRMCPACFASYEVKKGHACPEGVVRVPEQGS